MPGSSPPRPLSACRACPGSSCSTPGSSRKNGRSTPPSWRSTRSARCWSYGCCGPQLLPFLGKPGPILGAASETGQAVIPAAAAGMPALAFPGATMVFFQFVFAAITVIILAGAVLGRMSFRAWVVFVPLWMTFVYTIGAFSLWGGGWLASLGVVDFSGGYVIHLAAATSGFVAAAMVGP